jgi:hypothetical protein
VGLTRGSATSKPKFDGERARANGPGSGERAGTVTGRRERGDWGARRRAGTGRKWNGGPGPAREGDGGVDSGGRARAVVGLHRDRVEGADGGRGGGMGD